MNKKVRELVSAIIECCGNGRYLKALDVANNWLEQNQPEPVVITVKDLESSTTKYRLIHTEEKLRKAQAELDEIKSQEPVVGLSDEQIWELSDYFRHNVDDWDCETFEGEIKEYLKTQTFALPEVKEIPVGLSDEQLTSLHNARYKDYLSLTDFLNNYRQWSKNQIFTQSSEADKAAIEQLNEANRLVGDYIKVCDDGQKEIDELQNKCELLELELDAFKFNWNDAPLRADEATITLSWYRNGTRIEGKHLAREERPKPTPQVEVGQVWQINSGCQYKVLAVGMLKDILAMVDSTPCVTVITVGAQMSETDHIYTETMTNFLAKFERVS